MAKKTKTNSSRSEYNKEYSKDFFTLSKEEKELYILFKNKGSITRAEVLDHFGYADAKQGSKEEKAREKKGDVFIKKLKIILGIDDGKNHSEYVYPQREDGRDIYEVRCEERDTAPKFAQSLSRLFPNPFFKTKEAFDKYLSKAYPNERINCMESESLTPNVENIGYVPIMFGHIVNKHVIAFDYEARLKGKKRIVFHPHYMKEYNSAWYVFGQVKEDVFEEGKQIYNIAIDGIRTEPVVLTSEEYAEGDMKYYEQMFANRIGVSSAIKEFPDEPMDVSIRARTPYILNKMMSKKWHETHKVDEETKEIKLNVVINMELVNKIFSYGPELKVIKPEKLRTFIKKRVADMIANYY